MYYQMLNLVNVRIQKVRDFALCYGFETPNFIFKIFPRWVADLADVSSITYDANKTDIFSTEYLMFCFLKT